MKAIVLFPFIFVCFLSVNAQRIFINEVMADNESATADEEGDFPDWIELYNDEMIAVDLEGFFLSDDEDEIDKWTFPQVSIPPKGFLIVFASDKNEVINGEIHTSFKVSASGETLLISDNSKSILNQIFTEKLEADQSFGRVPDGSQNFVPLNTFSPAASNNESDYLYLSHEGGFYQNPFYLKIESALGDSIFCTVNGELPTTTDILVKDSILITDRNSEPNYFSLFRSATDKGDENEQGWIPPNEVVDKATPLRCGSFKNGKLQSAIFNQTYFVDEEIFKKHTLPVISLVTEEANFFDDEKGIYVLGKFFDIDNPQWSGNFFESGIEWERPVHISYFNESGELQFEQNAGARIHGGRSRFKSQKTLRLYARDEYGKNRFEYQLLPQNDKDEYKVFLLETTMKAWTNESILNDQLAAQIVRDFDIEYSDYQPVSVFVNGEYWGIHSIRERPDERFLEEKYDFEDRDSLDIVTNGNWYLTSPRALEEYKGLIDYVTSNDLAENQHYDFVQSKVDINNYLDYYVAELFLGNYDWPGNNVRIWKYGKNGKWRWIFYDLDGAFREADYNMLEHATADDPGVTWPNSEASTRLFRSLLKNKSFTDLFLEKCQTYLNTTFRPQRTLAIVETMKEQYVPQLLAHINRWTFPRSIEGWEDDVKNFIESFLRQRPCFFVENLNTFFPNADITIDYDCETSSVDPNVMDDQFDIVPNPTDGRSFLINGFNSDLKGTLSVYSADSKLVIQEEELHIPPNSKKEFHFPNLRNGLYFVVFDTTAGQFRERLVVGRR